MKKLIFFLIALGMLISVPLSAQNANVVYSGNAQSGDKVYCCAYDGYINMRQAPSYQADKVGKFKNGSTGAILVQNYGEWMQIDNNGTIGYVPSRFVQDEPTVEYVGSATANDISGIWTVRGPYNVFNIYDNGYWMAYGNYFPLAYGYYIMQNNEVKLIAIEKISPNHFDDNGNLLYLPIREVYDVIDINSLNSETRVEFLTGNELEEDLEGIDPYYCTEDEFKEEGKKVANRMRELIIQSEQQIQQTVEHSNDDTSESVAELTNIDESEELIYEEDSLNSRDTNKIIKIAVAAVLGILVLVGLFFLIRMLVRFIISIVKKFVAWAKVQGNKTQQKASSAIQTVGAKAKEQLDSVKSTVTDLKQLSEQTTGNKPSLSKVQWLLIIGAYVLLFWDITFGLLILLAIGIYKIAKKYFPTHLKSLSEFCQEKLQPITSDPMLTNGLICLIIGWVIYRIFSGLIGFLIIVSSIIFLCLRKFAPSVSEKIFSKYEKGLEAVESIWRKKWGKIAIIACLIILPLSMSLQQTSILSITPMGAEVQEYHIDRKIEKLEDKDELSPREELRLRALELKKEREEIMRKITNPSSWQESQNASAELERIDAEEERLLEEAEEIGVYSLMLL
jgi:ABC-type multidrug transport system fused ATPase/permease subunit